MRYYLIGIGGIGMSALARYFKQTGHEVSGYDRTASPLTKALEQEGIAIHYDDDPTKIPEGVDLAIYTPAIAAETAELQYIQQRGIALKKRSQVLGELTRGKRCIAVAGTHGKTSTTALVTHLLRSNGVRCNAFMGGISKNLNSNMVVDEGSEYVVVEADEYDRSFLQLHPSCSIITSTDADHLDIYGTHEKVIEAFEQFVSQTEEGGMVIVKRGLLGTGEHHEGGEKEHHAIERIEHQTYTGSGIEADYYPWNVRTYKGNIFFDLRTPKGVIYDIEMDGAPLYNVENAVAAVAVGQWCGLTEHQIRHGLKTYAGVKRRFDYQIKEPGMVFVDDYAHHPAEIATTIASLRQLYPGKRIIGVFQPHLYSRTADFAEQFAEALEPLDEIVLMPIYAAREKPINGVTSHTILHRIDKMEKYLCTAEQVLELVPALYGDVVVTLGAGDIDRLVPKLKEVLIENM